jgi:hypothetical protein
VFSVTIVEQDVLAKTEQRASYMPQSAQVSEMFSIEVFLSIVFTNCTILDDDFFGE